MATDPIARRSSYSYVNAELNSSHSYLLPSVFRMLDSLQGALPRQSHRLFDLGCGNGSVSHAIASRGWDVIGVDTSIDGIAHARAAYRDAQFFEASAYDDLAGRFGCFPVVLSLEVVEHLYDPRQYAATLYDLLEPGGTAIVSTPFHGYWKNLAIAVMGRFDQHVNPLYDHGHIKFWSFNSLGALLREVGLTDVSFSRVGRVPALAKSMIATARRPKSA